MSLSQRILKIWRQSQYLPPRVPLLFYDNEYMAVVDDTQSFLRFISSDGQIFLALNTHCQISKIDEPYFPGKPATTVGDTIYVCSKIDPILCSPTSGPESIKDIFVLNYITPLL